MVSLWARTISWFKLHLDGGLRGQFTLKLVFSNRNALNSRNSCGKWKNAWNKIKNQEKDGKDNEISSCLLTVQILHADFPCKYERLYLPLIRLGRFWSPIRVQNRTKIRTDISKTQIYALKGRERKICRAQYSFLNMLLSQNGIILNSLAAMTSIDP